MRRVLLQLFYDGKTAAPFCPKFYDLLVSRNPLSKTKNREICENHSSNLLNCERSYDMTDVSALIYYRKPDA